MNAENFTPSFINNRDHAVDWLLSSYGYVIPRMAKLTGTEFAEKIAEVYNREHPRNAYAIKLAQSLSGVFHNNRVTTSYKGTI